MKNQYKLTALSSAVIAALTFATPLMAQEGNAQDDKEVVEQVAAEAGEEVVVRDTRAEAMTAFQQLNRQEIANRPQADGNITDLLRSNPNVQFSNSSSNSLQMGDIRPANISIHGSLSYQNNFMIDGISTNSDLDPAQQDGTTVTRMTSSDEQGFYVDAGLVESITVYDSNVPVEFSGFTGGVIDTQTRRWSGENHFNVYMRGTEAGWTEMIYDEKLQPNSGKSDVSHPGQYQTDFEKRTYGFTGEFGIADNMGFVIGYNRRESKIPQLQVATVRNTLVPNPAYVPGGWDAPVNLGPAEQLDPTIKENKQTSDNLFIKSSMYLSDFTELDLAFNYTSFENKGFLPTVADSDFEDNHDGYNVTANLKHRFENALWSSSLGYSYMVDERHSADTYISVSNRDPSSPIGIRTDVTGGYGSLEATQSVVTAKTKLDFDPIQYQNTSHQFTVGADFSYTEGKYKRDTDYYQYQNQMGFMWSNTVRFKAGEYSDDYQILGLFGQHTMEAGDWTFRTGVRGEYDDFTEDFNVAPRFTASWDVLGNAGSILTFGANRYYGRTVLAYALYGAQNGGMQTMYGYGDKDSPEGDWDNQNDFRGLDDLETPYDDELSLGFTQRLPANWLANLSYVHRKGKKGVKSWTDAESVRYFGNTGKSEHDSVSFAVSNTKPMNWLNAEHYVRFSAAWQETKSNMGLDNGYDDLDVGVGANFDPTRVVLDDKVINTDDLESTDFSIPLRLMLETTSTWHQYGLTWFNFLHMDGDRDQVYRITGSTQTLDDGSEVRVYKTRHFGTNWAWDTKLQYRPDWARGMEVAVEVNNVLNNENVIDSIIDNNVFYDMYESGRQFWVQLSYNY